MVLKNTKVTKGQEENLMSQINVSVSVKDNSGRRARQRSWDVLRFPSDALSTQTPTHPTRFKVNIRSEPCNLIYHPWGAVWDLHIWPPPKSARSGITGWWWLECPALLHELPVLRRRARQRVSQTSWFPGPREAEALGPPALVRHRTMVLGNHYPWISNLVNYPSSLGKNK